MGTRRTLPGRHGLTPPARRAHWGWLVRVSADPQQAADRGGQGAEEADPDDRAEEEAPPEGPAARARRLAVFRLGAGGGPGRLAARGPGGGLAELRVVRQAAVLALRLVAGLDLRRHPAFAEPLHHLGRGRP